MLKVFLPENYGKKRLDKIVLMFPVLYIHIRIWVESHVLSFWALIFLHGALYASDLCVKQVHGVWSSRIHQKIHVRTYRLLELLFWSAFQYVLGSL